MVIGRATKEIAKDEEILWPYVAASPDNAITQQQYKKVWGFTCDCHICTLEAQSPAEQQKERQSAIAATKEFFGSNAPSKATTESIEKAEQLWKKLEKTYDKQIFANSPRLGLVDLGIWQCRAYQTLNAPHKVAEHAEGVLRDLGYNTSSEGDRLQVDRTHCHLEGTAIEAAMQAAHAYRAQGKKQLADEYEKFGRELFVTMHGESESGAFAENYGATIKHV